MYNRGDMITGQLPKESIIRCDKVYSLDKNIVVKNIGHVSSAIIDTVKTEVISLIS